MQYLALDRALILAALRDLSDRLLEAGEATSIRIVGGAALAISHYDRRPTSDIDALLSPEEPALKIADAIARERQWPRDWINTSVKAFTPFAGSPTWSCIYEDDIVRIEVAPADMLLAMKLMAARGRRDSEDIDHLLSACQVKRLEDAESIVETYFPNEEMKERARSQIAEWLSTD